MPTQPATREQIQIGTDATTGDAPVPRWLEEPGAAPPPEQRESFGQWLLSQRDRGDWIDELATAARADKGFPKRGSADEVRARLQILGADGDAFEQLEDAERCWQTQ